MEHDVAGWVKTFLGLEVVWIYYRVIGAFDASLSEVFSIFIIQFGVSPHVGTHQKRRILVNSNGFEYAMSCLCPCLLFVEVH